MDRSIDIHSTSIKRKWAVLLLVSLMLILFSSCKDNGTSAEEPVNTEDISQYLEDLPSWDEFSPPGEEQPATPTGDPEDEEDVVMDVEIPNDDGEMELFEDVTYSCQSQPYTLSDNPQQIAMYSPDREIVYAGGLIQGKSHSEGLGSLLGLPISERAPVDVSIPGLANDDNFRTVEQPNQANVDQAIGSMVGGATASGLSTPSSISFKMETFHSEKQMALEMGLSGNYIGYEGSASGSIARNQSETTVTAQFYQKMYEVVVEAPQSPGDFFSEEFTEARLQQQIDQGRIGPDNLPVYVSNIVYGRMMMFSITSTASEDDIRATLQAGYNSIGAGGEVSLDAKYKSILEESKIKITSIGGDAEATLAMIRTGDWSQYFTENAPLSSASPMSYTFRNLGDGSIASVTETTEYNVQTCTARQATPGTFEFTLAQDLSLPVSAPATVKMGDVNGDGNEDIIYNHISANLNETAVAFSNGDGTFSMSSTISHSATPEDGWSDYKLRTGDFNNDGQIDLVWNRVDESVEIYTSLSNGDGTFEEMPLTELDTPGMDSKYRFKVGNIDGKDGDDLIWNRHFDVNRTYVGLSNGDGTFGDDNVIRAEPGTDNNDHPTSSGWSQDNIRFSVDDVDGDGRDDMIWHTYDQTGPDGHRIWVGLSEREEPGNMFDFPAVYNWGSPGWAPYEILIGDVDGNNGVDFVWTRTLADNFPTLYVDLSNSGSPLIVRGPADSEGSYSQAPPAPEEDYADDYETLLLDVDGDGRKDVLFNRMGTVNRSYIGLGSNDGKFDYSRDSQDHPASDEWAQFELLTGDINGDSREDIIYVDADATNRVYVGIARSSSQ